jgi:hypothetical protein
MSTATTTGTLTITLTPEGIASLEAYDAVERPAREAYDAAHRSAREAYDAAKRSAREAYHAVERQAREAYHAVERQAREAYHAVERQAREAYDAVERPAREALTGSPDPLVAWVVANVENRMDEALDLLRSALNGPVDADAYASRQGWCGEWQDLRAAAIAADVVTVQS